MTGIPLAVVWVLYLAAVVFLAGEGRVTWPVAFVFAVVALFIAVTVGRPKDGGAAAPK